MIWHRGRYPKKLNARKRRNHDACCNCSGWWFPHRVGSLASADAAEKYATKGCYWRRVKTVTNGETQFDWQIRIERR